MDCSNFEIWPVYMNYIGAFHLKFIYNKQSRPLIRRLLKEPSDLGTLFAKVYELVYRTIRVKTFIPKIFTLTMN